MVQSRVSRLKRFRRCRSALLGLLGLLVLGAWTFKFAYPLLQPIEVIAQDGNECNEEKKIEKHAKDPQDDEDEGDIEAAPDALAAHGLQSMIARSYAFPSPGLPGADDTGGRLADTQAV